MRKTVLLSIALFLALFIAAPLCAQVQIGGHVYVPSTTDSTNGLAIVNFTADGDCDVIAQVNCTLTNFAGNPDISSPYTGTLIVLDPNGVLTATRNLILPNSPGRVYNIQNSTGNGIALDVMPVDGNTIQINDETSVEIYGDGFGYGYSGQGIINHTTNSALAFPGDSTLALGAPSGGAGDSSYSVAGSISAGGFYGCFGGSSTSSYVYIGETSDGTCGNPTSAFNGIFFTSPSFGVNLETFNGSIVANTADVPTSSPTAPVCANGANGQLTSIGCDAPTPISGLPSCVVGTGAGSGATCVNTGSNTAGTITINTGTLPTANAIIETMTFNGSPITPGFGACVISPSNVNATTRAVNITEGFIPGTPSTTWTIDDVNLALTASTVYTWVYVCSI
jgi:hypothetical protein